MPIFSDGKSIYQMKRTAKPFIVVITDLKENYRDDEEFATLFGIIITLEKLGLL